jgi:hypothetical protein
MWWQYLVGAAVLIVAVYGFCLLVGVETRWLSSRTERTAQSMYGANSQLSRKQRKVATRYGQQHDSQQRHDSGPRA